MNLYTLQFVHLRNGTIPPLCEAWRRRCQWSTIHVASSPYMLDLSTHPAFIHIRWVEGSGEHLLMMPVLLPKAMLKVFWCFVSGKYLYKAYLSWCTGKSLTISCREESWGPLLSNVCWFLWCKCTHSCQSQTMNIMSLKVQMVRDTQWHTIVQYFHYTDKIDINTQRA